MATAKEKLDGVNARLKGLFKADGKSMMGFKSLADAAMRPGKISPASSSISTVGSG